MKIFARIKLHAKKNAVERIDDTHVLVFVNQPPHEGQANEAAARAIAEHYKVAPSRVSLVSGHRSKEKVFEIL